MDSTVPERGTPDRSDLRYLSAIEGYKKTDWTANWIWTGSCSEDSYVIFRKSFHLDTGVESATACISAADKYVLWVNGEMLVLDGSLKRGPTPYDSYYDTVEITNLKAGENIIAIQVAFNGRSGDGSINPVIIDAEGDEYAQGGLLFEMNAGGTVIKSDATWKAARNIAYKNRVTGGAEYVRYVQTSMLAEHNVWYDARDNMGNWTAADFDDSAWEDATLISKPGDVPFGDLYNAVTKPIRFFEIEDFETASDYVGKPLTEDTILVLPFPKNCQFTFYFELESEAGKHLTIYTDTYEYDGSKMYSFKDTYVTASGRQSYENLPWRSGTKLIIEAQAGVTFTRLGYRISEFNADRTPAFTSSNRQLDQLWLESQNTVGICMRDTFMDCPERERGPYMGDGSNEVDAVLFGYGEGGLEMTKKAILACVGWTLQDGGIPSRAPSVKPQEIPNQSLAFLSSAYHYWLHSGDVDTMTAYYKACVDYLQMFEMKDGLPEYRLGTWTWDDWGSKIDKPLLQVGFYYYALNLTSRLGDELGIPDGKDFLMERMNAIEVNWRDAYYTPEGFKSVDSKYIDERANAMLALSGLAGEEDYDLITRVIQTTQEASPFCEKFILEAACVMGRLDVALERMLDRYSLMLEDEYDTLWEQYWPDDGTINHGWTASPLYILSKYAAGIQPTSGGFASYTIAPTNLLDSFSCTEYTVKGDIFVSLSREGDASRLTVQTIDGSGTIVIPQEMGTQVIVTGGDCTVEGNIIHVTAAGTYMIEVRP